MNRKLGVVVTAAAFLWMLGLVAWAWTQLPPEGHVPLHWNAQGIPNRYGTRTEALATLAVPVLITLLVGVLLAVIPSIEPRRHNLALSGRPYTVVWIAVMVFLAGTSTVTTFATVGRMAATLSMGRLTPVAVGALLVLIGNYMGKVRSNFFFGIRTPWTLSSEQSWNRTHRLGGWLLILFGVAIAATALDARLIPWVAVGGTALLLGILLPYSYREWARDPNRQAIGR